MDRCTGRHCRPVLQLPTGQSCSLQTCCTNCWWRGKLLALTGNKPPALLNGDDPGAHGNERGQSTMNRTGASNMLNGGKNSMKGSGHGRQRKACRTGTAGGRTSHCRQTQPADSPPGTGLKRTAHSWPASQQNSCEMTSASRRAGKWGGVQRCWQP